MRLRVQHFPSEQPDCLQPSSYGTKHFFFPSVCSFSATPPSGSSHPTNHFSFSPPPPVCRVCSATPPSGSPPSTPSRSPRSAGVEGAAPFPAGPTDRPGEPAVSLSLLRPAAAAVAVVGCRQCCRALCPRRRRRASSRACLADAVEEA